MDIYKEEIQKCGFCSSTEITTYYNVGSDIWVGGEEIQHLDRCDNCNAWRFNCDVFDWEEGELKSYGKWCKDERDDYYLDR